MRSNLFLILPFIVILGFVGCAQSQDNESEKDQKAQEKPIRKEVVTLPVEDRDPRVDMINVEEFHPTQHWADYSGVIQGRDAKYYIVDGGYGSDLSFKLTPFHPEIEVIVIDSEDGMVLRERTGGEPVEWKTTLEQSGRFRIIVSLDASYDEKESVRTKYDIRITLKPE